MGCEEVLTVWIIQIASHDTTSSDKNVLFRIWVQEYWVVYFSTEANGVI
mgnify:CR=1 FL=1